MYQYLGDTGIRMYDLFNGFASYVILIYYFVNFKAKRGLLSKSTELCIKRLSEKKVPSFLYNVNLWTILEIFIIYAVQYELTGLLGVNGFFGDYFGTGANYFGLLIVSPLLLQLLLLLISATPLKHMDLITPSFPLALIFVKLACFFQGCCWGIECSFGLYNHRNDKVEFPVQLVEVGLALIIFIVLLCIKKRAKEGTLYPIYVIAYSATRFFSEFLRREEEVFWIFKKYHILCLMGVAIGVAQYLIIKKNKEKILRFYDRSCYIIIDFIYVVLFGFGVKKEKKSLHRKNNQRADRTQRAQLSDVKFDFAKIRMWILIWTLGLIGQIGWNVEGTWLNTFVYDKIDKNPSIITPMLILSALATTVSIFIFGSLTDKTGKRRNLISWGYIIWGILLMCFATTQIMVKNYFSVAIVCVVLGDMFISFFGSVSTDVGYSTWLTDIMNDENRGQIGAAIAVQSVLGSLLGNIINGKLVGSGSNYTRLFLVIGSLLSVFGIVSIFLFNKKDDIKMYHNKLRPQIKEPFTLKVLFNNKELLFIYICISIFFTGYNTYSPHLGNYLIHYLGYSAEQMGVIQAIPVLMAAMVTIPVSSYINKDKFLEVSALSIIAGFIGVLLVFPLTPESVNTDMIFNLRIFIAIFLVGVSYVVMLQATKTWTKKLAPKDSKGRFEVLFAIAFALIPMTFGSTVGENIVKLTGENIVNEVTNRMEYIPNGSIFLIGALISSLSFIPIMLIKKHSNKRLAEEVKK